MKKLNLKEIQSKEFDLLCEFDRVCRKHGLRYGLCGGTLLGAVRHRGFIPLDDDIDVEMPRPDYKKLIEISEKEFPSFYRLETPYNTDTIHAYGKLCDLRTELIEFPDGKQIHTHLYIDIFPIDGMPNDRIKQEKHRKKTRKRMLALYGFRVAKYKRNEKLNFFKRIFWGCIALTNRLMPSRYLIKRLDKSAEKYPFGTTAYNAVIVAGYGAIEIMPKIVFSFENEVEFCGKKFFATNKPDFYLTSIYGDYMQLPPEEKRICHEMMVYEPEEKPLG